MLGIKKVFRIIIIVSFLIMIIFADKVLKNNTIDIKYQNVKNQIKIDKVSVVSKLKESFNNKDIIAVLKIKGTSIDEVVVQAADNNFYLKRNVNKEEDKYGSIFMDYRNTINDKKILIYGHNSTKTQIPFHDLEKFLDKSFYDENHNIELTLENEERTYVIFSIMINKKGNYKHTIINFNDDEELKKHIEWMKNNSIYDTGIEVNIKDEILTLQTCYYTPKDSYLIINAKKI